MRRCLCILAALACATAALAAGANARELALFSAEHYADHVEYLASDDLAGRGVGSEGNLEAADYIARQFAAIGCQPAGDNGGFFQEFSSRQANRLDPAAASFTLDGDGRSWRVADDWIPMPFTKPGDIDGPVAFVGYGVDAKSSGYNDYRGVDARGKVLLMLRLEPENLSRDDKPSVNAAFSSKVRKAAKRGAKAVLMVDPPSEEFGGLYPFAPTIARTPYELPIIHVSEELANALLAAGGAPALRELEEQLQKSGKPASRDLPQTNVRIRQGVTFGPLTSRNVVARLPGERDDEVIVIGAHYDHVGVGVTRASRGRPVIFNGADDNASGVAGLIELARVLKLSPQPRRSIVFVAFGAEEIGLLGSEHFVRHGAPPTASMRAMINMDMIGRRNEGATQVFGVNTAYGLKRVVDNAARELDVRTRTRSATPGFTVSDDSSFQRAGVPTLLFHTGTHDDYHQPTDDVERLDIDGAVDVLRLVYLVARELAEMQSGPKPK